MSRPAVVARSQSDLKAAVSPEVRCWPARLTKFEQKVRGLYVLSQLFAEIVGLTRRRCYFVTTSTRLAVMSAAAEIPGAMVQVMFKHSAENVNESTSMVLTGALVEKADFLRDCLKLIFGDKVQKQRKFCHIDLLSRKRYGPPLLERAKILTGTPVSMANVGIRGGAFIVQLQQLKEHPEWENWPDTPETPYITLAFIGKNEMDNLSRHKKSLVLAALREVAELAVNETTKRDRIAHVVRSYLEGEKSTYNAWVSTLMWIRTQ